MKPLTTSLDPQHQLTSTWQSRVWVSVHKQFHMKHVPQLREVEHEDPFEQDDIGWENNLHPVLPERTDPQSLTKTTKK